MHQEKVLLYCLRTNFRQIRNSFAFLTQEGRVNYWIRGTIIKRPQYKILQQRFWKWKYCRYLEEKVDRFKHFWNTRIKCEVYKWLFRFFNSIGTYSHHHQHMLELTRASLCRNCNGRSLTCLNIRKLMKTCTYNCPMENNIKCSTYTMYRRLSKWFSKAEDIWWFCTTDFLFAKRTLAEE